MLTIAHITPKLCSSIVINKEKTATVITANRKMLRAASKFTYNFTDSTLISSRAPLQS